MPRSAYEMKVSIALPSKKGAVLSKSNMNKPRKIKQEKQIITELQSWHLRVNKETNFGVGNTSN